MIYFYALFMTIYAIGISSCVIYLIRWRNKAAALLNDVGFCTKCFGSMPCVECGRGL